MEHTPTPWSQHQDAIACPHGGIVAITKDMSRYPERNLANAAFIVQAGNAHDDLLKALEVVKRQTDGGFFPGPIHLSIEEVHMIDAAIAKGRGEA